MPLTTSLPSLIADCLTVSGGKSFAPCFRLLSKNKVPVFSNATSDKPFQTCAVILRHSGMFNVLESCCICSSIAERSRASIFGLPSRSSRLLSMRFAASLSAIAVSTPVLPAPVAKNKGSAAGPVNAIAKEGIRLVPDDISHIPASCRLLISSTFTDL